MSGFTVSASQVLEQCRLRYMQTLCDIVAAREGFSVKLYTSGDDNLIKIAPFTKRNRDIVEAYKRISPNGAIYPYSVRAVTRNVLSQGEAVVIADVLTYVWVTLISSFIVQYPTLNDWLDSSEGSLVHLTSTEAYRMLALWTRSNNVGCPV